MTKLNFWKRFFGSHKQNSLKSRNRNLKVETLEERQLLSVSPDYGWYTTNPDAMEFEIDTAGELVAFANIVNGLDGQTAADFSGKTIKMTGDIDLADVGAGEWNPIGTDSNYFLGNFDGQDYSITNLNITEFNIGSSWVSAGLFGWVSGDYANPSSIKNVNLSGNISITWSDPSLTPASGEGFGNGYVGLLVAQGPGYGVIENCSVDGAIYLAYTGTGTDNVDFQVGGVVGDLLNSNMNNVSSSVKITLETENNARKANVGGVIGISIGDSDYGFGNITASSYNGSGTDSYDISATNGGNVNGGGVCGLTMNVNTDISDRLTVNDANLYFESTTSYVQAGGLYGAKNGGSDETSPIGQVTNCTVNADVAARAGSGYAIAGGLIGGVSGAKSGNIAGNTFTGSIDVETTSTSAIQVYTGGMIGWVRNNVADEGNGFTIVDNYVGAGTTVKADSTGATGFTNIGGIIGNIGNTNIKVVQNKATNFPVITAAGPAITQGLVVGMTKGTTELLIDQDMVNESDFALVGNSTDTVAYILAEDITFAEGKKLQIAAGQNVVLDLNGFKLSGAADCVIENKGTLKITDSSDYKSGCVENTATTAAGYAISNNGNGKLEIQAGKYIGKNNGQTAEALNLKGSSATTLVGGSYSSTNSNAYYTKVETATITYSGYSAVPATGAAGNEICIVSAKIRITSGSGGVTTADNLADALSNAQSDSTIVLTEGEYEITAAARTIDKNLKIIGEGKVVVKFASNETQYSTFFEINNSATISFENVIFTGSTAGLFFNKGALTLKNCAVVNNSGKLFDVTSGSLQMSNTIFANNDSEYLIDNTSGTSICTIINCTFVKNNGTNEDGLITLNSVNNVTWNNVLVDNCINNEPVMTPISGSTVGHGSYMDYTHPEFFEGGYPIDDPGWINWDGKLAKTASSLINRGYENSSVKAILGVVEDNWNPVTDYAGNSRKSGNSIDIGAYELDYVNTPEFNSEDSLSTSEVKLTWDANNAVDFNLYISSTQEGEYTLVDDDKLVISGYSAIVSGLNTNTQYWFKLEAINSEGTTSKLSHPYFAYTLAAKPVNLQANAAAANTITVTFDDGEPAHRATGYLLYQKTGDSEYVVIDLTDSNVNVSGTKYTIRGLTGGTTYAYKLSAMNARGRGNFAETTVSATAYVDFPVSTTFVAASSNITSQSFDVNLTNILNANNVNGTYTVSVYTDQNFSESSLVETKTLDQTADNTDPVAFQFNNLSAGVNYYIKASVWGKVGDVPTYLMQDNSLAVRTNIIIDTTVDYNGVYDAAAHGINVSVTGPSVFEVKYKDGDGNYTLDECPQYTNAGTYTIGYKVSAVGYDDIEGTKNVVINKVNLTVSGTNVQTSKIYDANVYATVLDSGTPSSFIGDDASKVTFATTASYDTPDVGTGKTITVRYTLTDNIEGANVAANYILPEDYIYSTSGVIRKTVVDTLDDVVDANDGKWSLREAISNTPASGIITFAESLAGKTITLSGSELIIDKSITIDASALTGGITINANQASRVFYVTGGTDDAPVRLNGLKITGGNADNGGGIYNDGTLTVTNSTISDNSATSNGGGIYNNVYWTLTVTNSTISGNSATNDGGGIYNYDGGRLTVTNSTISDNSATSNGGGIYNYVYGTLTVTNTTIAENSASNNGGGVCNDGSIDVYNTIIACNNVTANGTDIYTTVGTITANYSLSSYTAWNGTSNLEYDSNNPLFFSIENNDYRLAVGSQALNQGNNDYAKDAAWNLLEFDRNGNPRIMFDTVDIGAYEFQGVIVVDTVDDVDDPDDGKLSLQEAISETPASGIIMFDESLAGKTMTLSGAELIIDKPIIIDASALIDSVSGMPTFTLSGNTSSRIFHIKPGTGTETNTVVLTGLILTEGNGVGSVSSGSGGAILNQGNLMLDNCVLRQNTTTNGNGGALANLDAGIVQITNKTSFENNTGRNGGAIYNYGTNASINIAGTASDAVLFSQNGSNYSGGAIANRTGIISVEYASFDASTSHRNSTEYLGDAGHGGAIYNAGTLTVQSSEFKNCVAQNANGGAIANASNGTLTLIDVKIGGFTDNDSNGIFSEGDVSLGNSAVFGGGIINGGQLNLSGVSIQCNTAQENGGGISNTSSGSANGSVKVIGVGTEITSNVIEYNTATDGYGGGMFFAAQTELSLFGGSLAVTNNSSTHLGSDVSVYRVAAWPVSEGAYTLTVGDLYDYFSMSDQVQVYSEQQDSFVLQSDCSILLKNIDNDPLVYRYTFDIDGKETVFTSVSSLSPDLPVGTYQGTVELTDSLGNSLGFGKTSQTLEIVATPPTFYVEMNEQPGSSLLKLNLSALIPDGNVSDWQNVDWTIQWGDGSETVVSPNFGFSLTALHYYRESGTFDIRLSVNGEEWMLGVYSTTSSAAVQELSSFSPESAGFNSVDLNTEVLNSALPVNTAEKTVEKSERSAFFFEKNAKLFLPISAKIWSQENKAVHPLFSSEISSDKLVQDMLFFDSSSRPENSLETDELFWDDFLLEQAQKRNDDDSLGSSDSLQQDELQTQTSIFNESFLDELTFSIL